MELHPGCHNMNIGMLWSFDNPKLTLKENIVKAAEYYKQKYNKSANMCHINQFDMPKEGLTEIETVFGLVAVLTNRAIMPKYLWIGKEEN